MAKRPNKNDISIGKERWIEFGDLANSLPHAVEIDSYLTPIMPFMERLETSCMAECCGIDAFALWPEHIEHALAMLTPAELEALGNAWTSVEHTIEQLPSDTVVSTRMNQYFRKRVFLELLAHIREVIQSFRATGPASKPGR